MISNIDNMSEIVIAAVIVAALFGLGILLLKKLPFMDVETPERTAGRLGETFATGIICEILKKEDTLLTNIPLSFNDKQTELDNLIINEHGVFIIEVKNLYGMLSGDEDSYQWIQTNDTGAFGQRTVKNPIKQVKRQIGILSDFLKDKGIDVPVEGYVFFVGMNSPVKCNYVLETQADIDLALHNNPHQDISKDTQVRIVEEFDKLHSGIGRHGYYKWRGF